MSGAGHTQRPVRLQLNNYTGSEPAMELTHESPVDASQHLSRPGKLFRQRANRADNQRHSHCSGQPLAAHIAHHHQR